jgi:RNA polymerase sigma factor (sigma-70 family)
MSREQEFLGQLPVIDRVISWVCARRGLRGADAEDFASLVRMRLIENDYAILGRFEGRSSFRTYVAAVVNHLYLDFQVQRFGKWRPSAEARRLGPVALRLECLLYRDGLTFDEACGVLQSDPRVSAPREALHDISLRLPRRDPRGRPSGGPEPAEDGVPALERAERQGLADRTFAVIRRTIDSLPACERLFLRLHVESGLSVAQVARALGLEQKSLYRRKDQLLKLLRDGLEAEGIVSQDAQDLLASLDWEATLGGEAATEASIRQLSDSRPSREKEETRPLAGES